MDRLFQVGSSAQFPAEPQVHFAQPVDGAYLEFGVGRLGTEQPWVGSELNSRASMTAASNRRGVALISLT
jgi:hypothetical protein